MGGNYFWARTLYIALGSVSAVPAAGLRGLALVCVRVCAEGVCRVWVLCVWARVWERPGRCVGLLSQGVEKEKETVVWKWWFLELSGKLSGRAFERTGDRCTRGYRT